MTQLRMGIIGLGARNSIINYWHKPDGNSIVVAASDLTEEALKNFKQEYGPDTFITTDYKELLSRKDVDAVAILTPDYLHEEHVIAALKAGKHVYCEKPLAINVEGCDRILDEEKSLVSI